MNPSTISIARSVRWIGISQAAQVLIQLAGVLVLAHILPPSDFGLLAMATTVTNFANLFRDMGTGAALIQREHLKPELIETVFWFNVLLGLTLGLTTAALASLAALAFDEPRLQSVLFWLAFAFPLASLSVVHQALLERASRFRSLAAVNINAGIVGLVVAVLCARQGAGVYALVAQTLATTVVATILLWQASRWRPKFHAHLHELKSLTEFSGNLFLFNTANYFHRNADTMLIGRFLGTIDLGLYNLAYRLLLFPLQNITFVVTRAAFPAYSRSQQDIDALATHYLTTLQAIALITAPTMALLWVLRVPFVEIILGQHWLRSTGVIAWLAPVGFLQSIIGTSGMVLMATMRTRVLRNLGFIGVPFLAGSFFLGLPWGIKGVAAAYCLANLVWLFPVLYVVMKALHRDLKPALVAISTPVFAATIAAAAVALLNHTDMLREASAVLLLSIGVISGAIFYILMAWILCRSSLVAFVQSIKCSVEHN